MLFVFVEQPLGFFEDMFGNLLGTLALAVASPAAGEANGTFLLSSGSAGSSSVVAGPDDPFYQYGYQWGLNGTWGIGAPAAWEYTTGSKRIRVGIIDSGISGHSDLIDNLVSGWDFVNNDAITDDDVDGHGTFVAGIVGAKGNNGIGMCGVCWDVSLVPMQIYGRIEGGMPMWGAVKDAAIDAIEFAKTVWGTPQQIDILNISAFDLWDKKVDSIIRKAAEFQGLVVWSAGNSGNNLDNRPSGTDLLHADNLIIVGAMTNDPTVVRSSNYSLSGDNVHVWAPGCQIFSSNVLLSGEEVFYPDDGTSFAAPFITGLAALMLSYHPRLTAYQIKKAIVDNAPRRNIVRMDGSNMTMKRTSSYLSMSAVSQMHCYRESFVSLGSKRHLAFCYCGDSTTAPHAVNMSQAYRLNGRLYAPCIDCGEIVCIDTTPIISPTFFSNGCATANGSYVLPDGALVISDADMKAYKNGDLVFACGGEEI